MGKRRFLLQHNVGGLWLVVEEFVGIGDRAVLMSIRRRAAGRNTSRPGPRLCLDQSAGRAKLLALAYDLIAVADRMLPETTMVTSEVVATAGTLPAVHNRRFNEEGHRIAAGSRDLHRERDAATRWRVLERRLPALQRAQRVLERCDRETAEWLEDVLTVVERTGRPPVLPNVIPAPGKPPLLVRAAALMRAARARLHPSAPQPAAE